MPSSCSTSSMRRSVGSHSLSPSGSSISKMLLWPCRRRTMFPPRGLLPLALRDSRRPESLPVHLRQFPQQGLQFLPDRYPTAHRLSQRLWHVISRGGARRSPKTHVEMRPMLLALLAAAAGSAAGAIGFGKSSKQGAASELGETTQEGVARDRKSTRLNSSHGYISYAVFCLKKKNNH